MIPSRSNAAFTRSLQTTTSANVVCHSAFSSRVLQEPLHAWRQAVIDRLDELVKLDIGWDGYGAPPVSFATANFAASMLASACPVDAPQPQIVPGPNGDLQIEWHTATADIELLVRGPYDVQAWRETPSTPEGGEELRLTNDFKIVASWIKELAESAVAPRFSAAR